MSVMSVMTVSRPDMIYVNRRSKSINENGGNKSIISVTRVMTESMPDMTCENTNKNGGNKSIECDVCDDGIQARHDMCEHKK